MMAFWILEFQPLSSIVYSSNTSRRPDVSGRIMPIGCKQNEMAAVSTTAILPDRDFFLAAFARRRAGSGAGYPVLLLVVSWASPIHWNAASAITRPSVEA